MKVNFFHPVLILIYVLALHTYVGLTNFSFYSSPLTNNNFIYVSLVFGLGLFASLLFNSNNSNLSFFPARVNSLRRLVFSFLFIAITLAFIYVFILGFSGSGGFWARFSRIPILLNFIHLGIPCLIYLFLTEFLCKLGSVRRYFLLLFIYSLLLVLLGYRSPLFILYTSIFAMYFYVYFKNENVYKKMFLIGGSFFAGFLVISLLSVVALYRVNEDYDFITYYQQINWGNVRSVFYPFMPFFATIRADYIHLNELLLYLSTSSYSVGDMFLSDFLTILPGTQLGSRNIVGDVIGARVMPNGVPMSITVSLHGILFADFGWAGLLFFSFLIGLFVTWSFNQYKKGDLVFLPLFVFIFISFLKSIHSGYLDFSFYFQLIFILGLLLVSKYRFFLGR